MRYLFDSWDQVARRIRTANEIRLYLDFDGTLVAFQANPDQVKLREKTRSALRRLAKHRRVHVAIVSGRRRESLAKLLNVRSLEFMGLYGWEDKSRGPLPARTIKSLSTVRKILGDLAKDLPGVFLEDKGISLAMHFRNTSAAMQRRAKARIRKIVAEFRHDLHVLRSSSAWDIVPIQVRGKGEALRNALSHIRKPFLAIYAGDDITDEPAFKELSKGITVLVGEPRKTRAQFRLNDSLEVYTFLTLLEAELL
jgi:trehalose-phosphatase